MNKQKGKTNKQAFRESFDKLYSRFGDFLDKYEETNPEWVTITAFQLIYKSILSLKNYIEKPEGKEISWDNPIIEIRYPYIYDEEKLRVNIFKLMAEEIQNREKIEEIIKEGFVKTKELYILRALCNDIGILKEGNKCLSLLPKDRIAALEKLTEKLTEKERTEAAEKLYDIKPFAFFLNGKVTDEKTGKERRYKSTLFIQFNPLVIDKDAKEAYYPICVGLEFKGFKPDRWSEKDRQEFWDTILKSIKEQIPEEKFDFELEALPEPTVRPISKETALVKIGMHAELRKFGEKPKPSQLLLFDLLNPDTKQEVEKHKIEVIGIDNTQAQNRALFAIQKLLYETNYKGNLKGHEVGRDNSFKFKGYLPILKFTPAQYLEAYGVGKRETARGYMEFNANERAEALQALRDLHDKRYLFYYERKNWIKNSKGQSEERFDVIKTVRPLITITEGYEALTRPERDIVKSGESTQETDAKLKYIVLEPCPILVDQIDKYFVLKPANCYQEVKLLVGKASKYVYLFIDYLLTEAELNRRKNTGWIIKLNYETLAYKLRMDSYIKRRRTKRIRQTLNRCYEIAKQLGYLLDYRTIQGVTQEVEELTLNPEKFRKVKEIEAKLAELNSQEEKN